MKYLKGITWMNDFHIRCGDPRAIKGADVGPDAYPSCPLHQSVSPHLAPGRQCRPRSFGEGGGTY
jgi:hypothetical protein